MDFEFRDEGSLCFLTPRTNEALDWLDGRLPEDHQEWGGAVVIEHRYAENILHDLVAHGFTIG